jgi:hypothetical protein
VYSTPFNTLSHTADTVTFNAPAALATGATVVLNGVKNPSQPGLYHLDISAQPTVSGMATVTSSSDFEIVDPCIASEPASAWGPLNVTLTDSKQSVTGCPRFTRYTITSTSPTPAGCALASGTSNITVTLPTAAGVNLSHVTSVALKVDGAAVPSTFAPVGTNGITITPGGPVPNGKNTEIAVDVVRNPDAPAAMAVVKLKAQVAAGVETGETTSPAFAITAATAVDCAPKLDFYVRDWTTNSTTFDTGVEPSTSTSFVWESDVWNQSFNSTPVLNGNGWVTGDQPWKNLKNYAFARLSLVPTSEVAYDRDVTAKFYAALLGSGSNFVPIASVNATTVQLGSDMPANTYVSVEWEPGTFAIPMMPMKKHLCLAVEIDSPSDPLVGSIAMFPVGSNADSLVVAHNNRAQRNLELVNTPNPIPPPPPAPPAGGMGGGMSHFAIIHNEATRTRDITMRFDAPAEVVRQLVEPRVEVIGGERAPYEPGKRLTLPGMRPGESRWIALSYGLKAQGEHEMLPVSFSQVDGDRVVNGFAFGIRPSPLPTVVAQNLHYHADTFDRLAATAGSAEAKRESAAAAALLAKGEPTTDAYVRFMRDHQAAIAAITARLVQSKAAATDPVGMAVTTRELGEAVSKGDASAIAASHLALLERLSTLQTMRLLAEGNPFDIVQMVRWQHDLYATRPALSALPVAAGVVTSSQAFLDVPLSGKGDGARYGRVVGDSMKAFRATADALGGKGDHLQAALDGLAKQLDKKNTATLENAHREFLLALDDATSGSPAQTRN